MKVGDVVAWERCFSVEDVELFTRISLDEGDHHRKGDEQGRLLVHGLLTATLPTRVGGALNFLAREMLFEFLRPVYTGELIRCEVTISELGEARRGTRMRAEVRCLNPLGEVVLTGHTHGLIRQPLADVLAMPLPGWSQ